MFGSKTTLDNLKSTEIIQSVFSNHNVMKLETNIRRKFGKFKKMSKLNNTS